MEGESAQSTNLTYVDCCDLPKQTRIIKPNNKTCWVSPSQIRDNSNQGQQSSYSRGEEEGGKVRGYNADYGAETETYDTVNGADPEEDQYDRF